MRKNIIKKTSVIFLACVLMLGLFALAATALATDLQPKNGEAIVRVTHMDAADDTMAGRQLLDEAEILMTLQEKDGKPDDCLLYVQSNAYTTKQLIGRLEKLDCVAYAVENEVINCAEYMTGAEENPEGEISAYPDFTGLQWAFNGESAYGLDVPNWNTENETPFKEDVVVAVVDTGIDYTHPDLKEQMWEASPELIEKIGGGTYGYCSAVRDYQTGEKYGKSDPMDDVGHGTHCAGIIAAAWDGSGVSGISNQIKLMAVKVMNKQPTCKRKELIEGCEYICRAIDNGVNVRALNCSMGVGLMTVELRDAFLALEQRDVVIVVASGNELTEIDESKIFLKQDGTISNLVLVNALDSNGNKTLFTNYGRTTTDLFAPGSIILSAVSPEDASYIKGVSEPYKDGNGKLYLSDFEDGTTGFFTIDEEAAAESKITWDIAAGTGVDGGSALHFHREGNENAEFQVDLIMDLSAVLEATENENVRFVFYAHTGEGGNAKVSYRIKDSGGTAGSYEEYANAYSWAERQKRLSGLNPETITQQRITVIIMDETECCDFYIDNVLISDDVLPYVYYDGTSMAAPMVTGEAAVLSAVFPEDSAGTIIARVFSSVKTAANTGDPVLQPLTEYCITGGTASLGNALDESTYMPYLKAVTQEQSGLISLEGYFFGAEGDTPTVTVATLPAEIVSPLQGKWGELQKVTVKIPETLKVTSAAVELTTAEGRRNAKTIPIKCEGVLFDEIPLPEDNDERENDIFLTCYPHDLYAIGKKLILFADPSYNYESELHGLIAFVWDPDCPDNNGWKMIPLPPHVWDENFMPFVHNQLFFYMVRDNITETVELQSYNLETGEFKSYPMQDPNFFRENCGTIVSRGTDLIVFRAGTVEPGEDFDEIHSDTSVLRLDPEAGTVTVIGTLPVCRTEAIAGMLDNGDILLAGGVFFDEFGFMDMCNEVELVHLTDGEVTSEILVENPGTLFNDDSVEIFFGAVAGDGLLFSGEMCYDENGSCLGDTWIFRTDGTLEPLYRASAFVDRPTKCCCYADGTYYVLNIGTYASMGAAVIAKMEYPAVSQETEEPPEDGDDSTDESDESADESDESFEESTDASEESDTSAGELCESSEEGGHPAAGDDGDLYVILLFAGLVLTCAAVSLLFRGKRAE